MISALPKELEYKVPPSLVYWKKGLSREERLRRRKILAEQLAKQLKEMSATHFVLTRRTWKGAKIIRDLPVDDYHLKLPCPGGYKFHLDKNPIYQDATALQFTESGQYFREGTYPPMSSINPNKKIPCRIEIIDSGPFTVERSEPLLLQINFKGKKLKGMYIFKRTSKGDKVWQMIKQKAPQTKKFSTIFFKFRKQDFKVKTSDDIKFPYPVSCVAFAEGYWHRTWYPWSVIKKRANGLVGATFVVEHSDGLLEEVGKVESCEIDEKNRQVIVHGHLWDTQSGKDMAILLENNEVPGVSVRIEELTDEQNGQEVCQDIVRWVHVAFTKTPELGAVSKILCSGEKCKVSK